MLWNKDMETLSRADLRGLQVKRLQETVARVYEHVPFYRETLARAGVSPVSIRDLEDLRRLPFTRKSDFRDQYPWGLLAVPMQEVIRIHASSGTTGRPIFVAYTRNDVAGWAELCARCLASAGARPGDVFHNAYGYGLFTGGLGFHYGAELMGLPVVPVSGGNTERQILLLQDLRPRVIACTPSYALTLAEVIAAKGISPASLGLRCALLGAEPWSEGMRQEIEQKFGMDAINIYGLSEVVGPGVSCECVEAKAGLHVYEDHFLPEVVDPATGEPLPVGEEGELVFTTLTKEALPVLRYRTGDLASLDPTPCACGRTSVRMSRIKGRADDMLVIRGVNVFPSQVEAALVGLPDLAPHYHLVVTREGTLDALEVQIELSEGFVKHAGGAIGHDPAVWPEDVKALHARLLRTVKSALGLTVTVTLLAPGQAPRSEGGKLKRVTDRRRL